MQVHSVNAIKIYHTHSQLDYITRIFDFLICADCVSSSLICHTKRVALRQGRVSEGGREAMLRGGISLAVLAKCQFNCVSCLALTQFTDVHLFYVLRGVCVMSFTIKRAE